MKLLCGDRIAFKYSYKPVVYKAGMVVEQPKHPFAAPFYFVDYVVDGIWEQDMFFEEEVSTSKLISRMKTR